MHDTERITVTMRFHERTKHRFNRYANGPGELDWANQPNPFRRYEGAPLVHLPLLAAHESLQSPYYDELYDRGSVPSAPLTIDALSRLLQYALAISAWKQAGATRWALRCNPSSGKLHPTEAYLLIGALRTAAATLGWSASLLHGPADETIEELLGLSRAGDFAGAEREHPDAVPAVWPTDLGGDGQPRTDREMVGHLDAAFVNQLTRKHWHGTANRLSHDDPVHWEVIDEVAVATRKPVSEAQEFDAPEITVVQRNGRTGSHEWILLLASTHGIAAVFLGSPTWARTRDLWINRQCQLTGIALAM
jgi:hypothetical protein